MNVFTITDNWDLLISISLSHLSTIYKMYGYNSPDTFEFRRLVKYFKKYLMNSSATSGI